MLLSCRPFGFELGIDLKVFISTLTYF
jgi:hypothetical protein